MKNIFVLFLLAFSLLTFAQNEKKEDLRYYKITQKKCIKNKGYHLALKEVANDSRCPEGVSCIWAGDVSIVVSVYKDGKLIEDNTVVISSKTNKESSEWFSNYVSSDKKNIKSITVFPYPKEGIKINPKDYFVKIGYVK